MPRVLTRPHGIEIEYETFGDPGHPAMLLVMGLGCQMIMWDDELCEMLAARGLYVIRYDNRDVGASTKLGKVAGPVRVLYALISAVAGRPYRAPYTLDDMADDGAGLLEALGIDAAHVLGSSMGGSIAQLIAIRHPTRVLSLACISGTTSDPELPRASTEVLAKLTRPPPMRRRTFLDHTAKMQRFVNGGVLPFDEERARARANRVFDRGVDIGGSMRHFLALLSAKSRRRALAAVTAPTLAIHGDADPVSHVDCGRDVADSVPDGRLLVIPGMGHDIAPAVWQIAVDAVLENTARATEGTPTPCLAAR